MFKIGNLEVYGVIYKITNKVNSKCYIGQTTDYKRRFQEHKNLGYGVEENKLFGKKYSHFVPCIVTTKDLELPKKLAKKLTSITV